MYKLDFYNTAVEWFLDDQIHRDKDLPATEYFDGGKSWRVNGKRHRVNGPAIMWRDNGGYKEYWINDQRVSEEEWRKHVHSNI